MDCMDTKIDLVICDFDNTLVDSEVMNTEMFVRFFAETAGVTSTETDRAYVDSAAFAEVIRHYTELYREQIKGGIGTIEEEALIERFLDYKDREIGTYPLRLPTGLDRLLQCDLPLAIVSGSYTRELYTVAAAAGLHLSRFTPILGSDRYHPWKPDPKGLLIAAEQRGAMPARVAVIEDSKTGLTAAQRAGMVPIHIQEFSILPESEAQTLTPHSYRTIDEFITAWIPDRKPRTNSQLG